MLTAYCALAHVCVTPFHFRPYENQSSMLRILLRWTRGQVFGVFFESADSIGFLASSANLFAQLCTVRIGGPWMVLRRLSNGPDMVTWDCCAVHWSFCRSAAIAEKFNPSASLCCVDEYLRATTLLQYGDASGEGSQSLLPSRPCVWDHAKENVSCLWQWCWSLSELSAEANGSLEPWRCC